jgi:hypothetical protein
MRRQAVRRTVGYWDGSHVRAWADQGVRQPSSTGRPPGRRAQSAPGCLACLPVVVADEEFRHPRLAAIYDALDA